MHSRFGLTLMVNHACNLRCTYCYTGDKLRRPMPLEIGRQAIDRALASLTAGGTLELGFFGGEPLIEAESIARLVMYAAEQADAADVTLLCGLTTNGTIDTDAAWSVMTLPDLRLAISHDGLPEVHDRHRITAEGAATSSRVLRTIERLQAAGKKFRVVSVVRPDTVDELPRSLVFLYDLGVSYFDLSLDLWARWTVGDGDRLLGAVRACADFWGERLPDCAVSWFDDKAGRFAGVPIDETARCGFGYSEIAVAPSGNLYPCERLIGADEPANRMRLAGHVTEGEDFLDRRREPGRSDDGCQRCAVSELCSTTCRCSNYIRTGDISRPDGLLCLWDQACLRETVRVLKARTSLQQREVSHDKRGTLTRWA
ncbi:MAG: radical SAM protein [Planctomycetota bacterium]|nr:MAG: radical SAM protein [Planctomycetota bacterium]